MRETASTSGKICFTTASTERGVAILIKTLAIANKSERVRVRVPHSVQQSIPIRRIYTNGIWEVGRKHSRSWRLTDVNYIAASDETQHNIFKSYCAALNSLPTDVTAKITIVNHRLNPAEFERRILLPYKDDWLDHYREEANAIMLGRAAQSNNLVQERFVTLSIPQRKISESRAYFRRAGANLQKTFARLDSGITPANNYDRLRILHDFFRPGYEQYFDYDDYLYMQSGKDFRDLICPDSISFKRNHFEFGNRFGRVLFLRTYASFVTDDLISDLTEYARDLILSIDMIPVPTDEAVKEVESIILGVDTDITRWQQRQNSRNNFTAEVPRTMEQKRENSRGFMDDLTQNDQRMIFSLITLVHTADSLEELDADTESLIAIGKEHLCDISPARFQQEDGLNTALPYGLRRIHALHTLTTESCAVAIPFRAQEIQDPGGLPCGINEISKNPLVCDRLKLTNPHGFVLGVTGSGKSVDMKSQILNVALATDDDIIIIDAEREYGTLARALSGEVIEISPHSQHHINPLEITAEYEDESPIAAKSGLITTILAQQMEAGTLSASHKSIVDRCTANVFKAYLKGKAPALLLTDWRREVMRQQEPEARELALAAELITEGSLDVFAHPTNVDMSSRIISLDLYEMGESLRPTALVVALEAVQNRVMENRKRNKYTWVFLDEVYLYFKYPYSAEVLYKAWKRFRKYGGIMTAATQNVEECLRSDTARYMFANSEYVRLFTQAATDMDELAHLLHISDNQMGYVTNAEPGHGLMKVKGYIIPFDATIPTDGDIYKLINTTPGRG